MIVDVQGRKFRNLRLSLTAACNYACTYCVPDGKKLQAASSELSADEMVRAVQLLVEGAGIEKLRITGGEPLLSDKFDDVIVGVMGLNLSDVALTTNGQLLPRKVEVIKRSGLRRINISLDTLDPNAFRSIARSGDLATVLHGIELMLDAGLKVKINMVPMRTVNMDQVMPMLDWCMDRNVELRFIELMNMGHLKHNAVYQRDFVGMDDLLRLVGAKYEYSRVDADYDSTSVRYLIPGGYFGIIPNKSAPFCSTCSRLRLTSDGKLIGCLSNPSPISIRHLLNHTHPENELQKLVKKSISYKQDVTFTGSSLVMSRVGG